MAAAGTDDGRDVIRDLERFYAEGTLRRTDDGRYRLADGDE